MSSHYEQQPTASLATIVEPLERQRHKPALRQRSDSRPTTEETNNCFKPFNTDTLAPSSSIPASSSSVPFRPISEHELIAAVAEKRIKAIAETSSTLSPKDRAISRERGKEDGGKLTREPKDGIPSKSLDTLDLCHMRIEKIPDGLVDIIKDDVIRLALGYNFISKIPDSFADLSCVRYLNIRANNIAVFPMAVSRMENLEILDMSRNKIRQLPDEPGRLLALRVLSMNGNRLTHLPRWVGKMKHLRILKLENNPLQWPPPHISKMTSVSLPNNSPGSGNNAIERDTIRRFEDRQMVIWIARLRSWINGRQELHRVEPKKADVDAPEEAEPTENVLLDLPVKASPPPSSDFGFVKPASSTGSSEIARPLGTPKIQQQPQTITSPPVQAVSKPVWLGREASANDVNVKQGQLWGPDRLVASPPPILHGTIPGPIPPIPKQFSSLGSPRPRPSVFSDFTIVPAAPQYSSTNTSQNTAPVLDQANHAGSVRLLHARNNSHSVGQSSTPQQEIMRKTLRNKKSLPDLRKSHEDILLERQTTIQHTVPVGATSGTIADSSNSPIAQDLAPFEPISASRKLNLTTRRPPLPQPASAILQHHGKPPNWTPVAVLPAPSAASSASTSTSSGGGLRKLSLPTVGATQAAAEAAAAALAARGHYGNTPPRVDGHGRMPSDKGEISWNSHSNSPTAARNTADFERNSYFRRLSTLPPSTISKAVPTPVLKFVDGTRGILFALSQIHAAIRQYITPVMDERISSQFHRVLDISNGTVTNLINSLDRFDSLSRRGTPEPSVIRGVLMTCRDSVITFRKLVSVLQLQLRALQSSADVRYTRTLLLMLYGSMAEVSNSWVEMAPQVDAVLPYLLTQETSSGALIGPSSSVRSNGVPMKSGSSNSSSTPTLPSIAESASPLRSGARSYILPQKSNRRRHAGSFSAQDVAQGATMGPSSVFSQPFNLENLQASSTYNTPARGMRTKGSAASLGNSGATNSLQSGSGSHSDYFVSQPDAQSTFPGTTAAATPSGSTSTGHAGFANALSHTSRVGMSSSVISSPARQQRSASNASSAAETSLVSSGSTPLVPFTSTASSLNKFQRKHSQTMSNGANSVATGSRIALSAGDEKVNIDDHLLMMIDQITLLSSEVWKTLLSHLTMVGIDSEPSTPTKLNARLRSDTNASANGNDSTAPGESATAAKKLRDLRDLAHSTAELTAQLRDTYLCAKEEEQKTTNSVVVNGMTSEIHPMHHGSDQDVSNPSLTDLISQETVHKLFQEAHHFVRAIVNTSTLIKLSSESHEFPRDLRRSLGEVTQACSNLTVYLLWLSPAST